MPIVRLLELGLNDFNATNEKPGSEFSDRVFLFLEIFRVGCLTPHGMRVAGAARLQLHLAVLLATLARATRTSTVVGFGDFAIILGHEISLRSNSVEDLPSPSF